MATTTITARALTVMAVLAVQSCSTLSPATRESLRAEGALVLVRAPTPMVPVTIRREGWTSDLGALFFGQDPKDQPSLQNITSRFGGRDPADLLANITWRRLKASGYRPTVAAGVRVRFENNPERWPALTGVSSPWVLHAQIDSLNVEAGGVPTSVTASLTLFSGERVELHTTCNERWAPGDEDRKPAEVWLELLRSCVDELLAPFDDGWVGPQETTPSPPAPPGV